MHSLETGGEEELNNEVKTKCAYCCKTYAPQRYDKYGGNEIYGCVFLVVHSFRSSSNGLKPFVGGDKLICFKV